MALIVSRLLHRRRTGADRTLRVALDTVAWADAPVERDGTVPRSYHLRSPVTANPPTSYECFRAAFTKFS